jgi:hypothetical protein
MSADLVQPIATWSGILLKKLCVPLRFTQRPTLHRPSAFKNATKFVKRSCRS